MPLKNFWGSNVTNIENIKLSDIPYDMFTFTMKLYGRYDVKVEYEMSMLGFRIKKGDEYIILSKLTEEKVLKGFDSYRTENDIIHNFKVLDNVLKTM